MVNFKRRTTSFKWKCDGFAGCLRKSMQFCCRIQTRFIWALCRMPWNTLDSLLRFIRLSPSIDWVSWLCMITICLARWVFFFLAYLMSICWRTFRSYGSYMAMIIWSFVNWFILMAIQVAKNKSIFCNVSCTNVGLWDSWNWLREVRQVCYDWRWYCNVIWYQCHGRWMPFLKEISDLA